MTHECTVYIPNDEIQNNNDPALFISRYGDFTKNEHKSSAFHFTQVSIAGLETTQYSAQLAAPPIPNSIQKEHPHFSPSDYMKTFTLTARAERISCALADSGIIETMPA